MAGGSSKTQVMLGENNQIQEWNEGTSVTTERERGQSTHSNKIGLQGGTGWVDLVERWLGRYG